MFHGHHRRRGYHHGALKEALVDAARSLIAERGPDGFTLLEAARMAGVSPAAPYRHFKDRQDLIIEVARRGFALFADRLETAWAEEGADRDAAFLAMGRAYMAFARQEPGYYGAMFGQGLKTATTESGAGPEAERAFRLLAQAAFSRSKSAATGTDPFLVGAHIWAISHGVATLYLPREASLPVSPERILESAVRTYLKGLASGESARQPETAPSEKS